jgi:hypothetical protein
MGGKKQTLARKFYDAKDLEKWNQWNTQEREHCDFENLNEVMATRCCLCGLSNREVKMYR